MGKRLVQLVRTDFSFFWSILLLTLVPLLPEYCAPFLAIGSLCAAAKDAHNRQTVIQLGTLGKLLLLFMAFQLLSVTYSYHVGNTLSTVLMWVVMFCGYLSLTTVLCNRRRLHTALLFVSVIAGVVGLIACSQYLLRDVFGLKLPNQLWFALDEKLYSVFPLGINLHLGFDRAAGTFNNPNILAEYLVMVIPFVGYAGFSGPRTKIALWMRGCLLLALLGVFVSFSRGAYIALLSMLLLLLALNFKHLTPFVLCLIAAVSLIPEAVTSRFLSIGSTTDVAITERFQVWSVAMQTIIERPLFGLGAGVSNFWDCLTNAGINAPHSHNLVLQLLVEGGFVLLFVMCTVATKILQSNLELANRRAHGHGLGFVLTMFVIAFVVYGMVDYPFLSPKLVGTFLMILGFAESVSHLYLSAPTVSLVQYPRLLWQTIRKNMKPHRK